MPGELRLSTLGNFALQDDHAFLFFEGAGRWRRHIASVSGVRLCAISRDITLHHDIALIRGGIRVAIHARHGRRRRCFHAARAIVARASNLFITGAARLHGSRALGSRFYHRRAALRRRDASCRALGSGDSRAFRGRGQDDVVRAVTPS